MTDPDPWTDLAPWPESRGSAVDLILVADAATRSRVARALDLEAVADLRAELTVVAWLDGMEVAGRVEAVVTRLCGVSLEPFDVVIDEQLRVRIVPAGSPHAPREAETVVDLDAEDPPDTADGDGVDIGAYVVEALALALDPFPRKGGVVFEPPGESDLLSPFSVLAQLKPKATLD